MKKSNFATKLADKTIRKFGYEHKITILVFTILDKFGKFWYNNDSESEVIK